LELSHEKEKIVTVVVTPNTSVRYLYVFCNTTNDGPVVLDLPTATNGSSLLGTVADAWQVPLTDIGCGPIIPMGTASLREFR
jgi:hypothetical protein